MTSYRPKLHPAKQDYVRAVGDLHTQLEEAMSELQETEQVTKSDVAQRLGWHKSVLSRIFNGQTNLTLRTLIYLAWALGRRASIRLEPRDSKGTANHNAEAGHPDATEDAPTAVRVIRVDTAMEDTDIEPVEPTKITVESHTS